MAHTRRTFLAAAAVASSSLAIVGCATDPLRRRAKKRPGEKLRLGVIGVGGRGGGNLDGMKSEDVVALCDVDGVRLGAAQQKFPAAAAFADYRQLIAFRGLDGVVISTPDHTHYPPAMMAARLGLDVYCEKPLTHTVAQARRLAELAADNGCVTQMGIQIHANENYRRVVEAIQAGVVGEVQRVHVFVNGTDWSADALPPTAAVPDDLDWDLWLGPARKRSFSPGYHPAGWRRYWAFGGGTTADMACHFMDLPFWALGLQDPVELQAEGPAPNAEGAPRGMTCDYWFPAAQRRGPVHLKWWGGNIRPTELLAGRGLTNWKNGVLFLGERGFLISNYTEHEVGPASEFEDYQPPPKVIAKSPGHHQEWIRCCKERTQPTCHFGYSGPLTEAVLLANVAFRAARQTRLGWDRDRLRLTSDAANELLDEPLRAGFGGRAPVFGPA